MNHKHVGPADRACDGCIREANGDYLKKERRATIAGFTLLIALVIVAMVFLSRWLTNHGSHMG